MRWNICRIPINRITKSCGSAYNTRMLHLKGGPDSSEEDSSKPLRFSTSKASHRHWTVDKSLGSDQRRPLWKVAPVSLTVMAILIWACFRKETEIDEMIYKPIKQLQEDSDDEPK